MGFPSNAHPKIGECLVGFNSAYDVSLTLSPSKKRIFLGLYKYPYSPP